jgi:hypothetical protein
VTPLQDSQQSIGPSTCGASAYPYTCDGDEWYVIWHDRWTSGVAGTRLGWDAMRRLLAAIRGTDTLTGKHQQGEPR